MKKIFKVIGDISLLIYLSWIAYIISEQMILGNYQTEQSTLTVTREVGCDDACAADSEGKYTANAVIEAKRKVLKCIYHSFSAGWLQQSYWIGDWSGADGETLRPLERPLYGALHNGDTLGPAHHDKDGHVVCPETFDLKYGQRGI